MIIVNTKIIDVIDESIGDLEKELNKYVMEALIPIVSEKDKREREEIIRLETEITYKKELLIQEKNELDILVAEKERLVKLEDILKKISMLVKIGKYESIKDRIIALLEVLHNLSDDHIDTNLKQFNRFLAAKSS